MVTNKDFLKAGIDVVLDNDTKPLKELAEKIALGKNYHKIKKAKRILKEFKEVMR